jgi:hypothetical protein
MNIVPATKKDLNIDTFFFVVADGHDWIEERGGEMR